MPQAFQSFAFYQKMLSTLDPDNSKCDFVQYFNLIAPLNIFYSVLSSLSLWRGTDKEIYLAFLSSFQVPYEMV